MLRFQEGPLQCPPRAVRKRRIRAQTIDISPSVSCFMNAGRRGDAGRRGEGEGKMCLCVLWKRVRTCKGVHEIFTINVCIGFRSNNTRCAFMYFSVSMTLFTTRLSVWIYTLCV